MQSITNLLFYEGSFIPSYTEQGNTHALYFLGELRKGSGCSSIVEWTSSDQEVLSLNFAKCWVFLFLRLYLKEVQRYWFSSKASLYQSNDD